jgi:hypothetical protein
MLETAGLRRGDLALTNVFLERPPNNDLTAWGVPRAEAKSAVAGTPAPFNTLIPTGRFVVDPARSVPALHRLRDEISTVSPNVIIALGNTALSALCGIAGIGKSRGALHVCQLSGRKVLPTYHPAAVARQYELKTTVELDLMKAARESETADLQLLRREINFIETVDDLLAVEGRLCSADILTFDIETKAGQITCIGLAPTKTSVFVVPFWHRQRIHWFNHEDEVAVVKIIRRILGSSVPKLAQNGIYDIQYLARYGIPVRNFVHDTMILHHALFPALPKGLDFLGSIYANERAWKRMRPRGGDDFKREE